MPPFSSQIQVNLEVGKIRTFAAALDWPGWCRSGRDETSAILSLINYGQRYTNALQGTQLEFNAPFEVSSLLIVERLPGSATTDFGAPDAIWQSDIGPIDAAELQRMQTILKAGWGTFDRTVQSAEGKTLRKGPRGGGRDMMKINDHVREAEIAYLGALGGRFKPDAEDGPRQFITALRQEILTTLAASTRGEIPLRGPRGGLRWTPRFFVRRLIWHVLDHAWEIEDRVE